ncbi:hypothetical protein TRIATDRAFT_256556 [Trichoderma atroviride IMI 206040]|uniref:Uncharacterized protein n=1 Tax=Hypocrea atroviridis (strain ATCC 20476 / IMI 206040) TaxID=452589 RepID=G9NRS3_HYPAI|nr:uncharacterized protein TRIATDRAFT_256556 [Trichoderma atroviride IMI 206040]EHK46705.1 hypothetical protein TRIATDRAFT_256556 [Trichoderma atroviride IMI 206040]
MLLEEYKCIKHFPLAPPLDSLDQVSHFRRVLYRRHGHTRKPDQSRISPCTSQFPLTNAQTMQIDVLRLDKLA